MELNFVLTILNRDRREEMEELCNRLGLRMSLTMLGRGTASAQHLLLNGLKTTEKAILGTVANKEDTHRLMHETKVKLYIDIPGNGVMMSVPIKSIGGSSTLAYLTDKPLDKETPAMNFPHELIYVILNEGHTDDVMAAALPAGATGGTVISAKGTGIRQAEKFRGLSLAEEKYVILIVARAETKAAIMKAVIEQAGPGTPAGAVCFSLPVSHVAGLRRIEED